VLHSWALTLWVARARTRRDDDVNRRGGELGAGGADSFGGRGGSRGVATLMALALLSVLSVTPSVADEAPVHFRARVLWIAGDTLMVATDDGQSVNVNLTRVPQDQYQRLRINDRVVVTGAIPTEQDRVEATSIEQFEP